LFHPQDIQGESFPLITSELKLRWFSVIRAQFLEKTYT